MNENEEKERDIADKQLEVEGSKFDLESEIAFLKKEFRVLDKNLTIPTDEEVVGFIRERCRKLGDKKIRAYLAGPIEIPKDGGEIWRNWLSPQLIERGVMPLDPVKLEKYKVEIAFNGVLKKLDELRRQRNWAEFRQLSAKIRYVDTNLIVKRASFIIEHIPERAPSIEKEALNSILEKLLPEVLKDLDRKKQELAMRIIAKILPDKILPKIFESMARGEATGGTSSENQIAAMKDIPILLVLEPRALDTFTSSWVLDTVLENGKIFESFNDLLDFLDRHLEQIRDFDVDKKQEK